MNLDLFKMFIILILITACTRTKIPVVQQVPISEPPKPEPTPTPVLSPALTSEPEELIFKDISAECLDACQRKQQAESEKKRLDCAQKMNLELNCGQDESGDDCLPKLAKKVEECQDLSAANEAFNLCAKACEKNTQKKLK